MWPSDVEIPKVGNISVPGLNSKVHNIRVLETEVRSTRIETPGVCNIQARESEVEPGRDLLSFNIQVLDTVVGSGRSLKSL